MSSQPQSEPVHLRGARIGSKAAVAQEMEELLPNGDPGIYWGGLKIPSDDGPRHFCVMGATGSGKTVLLRLLMQSILPRINAEYITPHRSRTTTSEQTDHPLIAAARNRPVFIVSVKNVLTLLALSFASVWFSYAALALLQFNLTTWDTHTIGLEIGILLEIGIPLVIGLIAAFFWYRMFVAIRPIANMRALKAQLEHEVIDGMCKNIHFDNAMTLACRILPDEASEYFDETFLNKVLFEGREFMPGDVELRSKSRTRIAPLRDNRPSYYESKKYRALVYDAKQDSASLIRSINPNCPAYILNPFDTRCAAWDMAKDIVKPSTADQVATILIPENKSASQPFFSNAARQLLAGVFKALMILNKGEWTFRDVVLGTKSKARLIALLERTPYTHDLVGQYLANEMTANSILSELATHIGPYEHIAAAWSNATTKISLSQWIKSESILILGNDEAHRTALDAVNRLVFQRLTEIMLSGPETDSEQNWIFLDEIREAGELEGLSRLLNKGRSKGVCVVLGFQDIDGLRSVYGDKIADEIVGQCNHMAILKLNSPTTAKWASERIGECETIDEESSFQEGVSITENSTSNTGVTRSPGMWFRAASKQSGKSVTTGTSTSTSTTLNQKKVIKAAVLASEFLNLPLTNEANGLTGFFIVPQVRGGAYCGEIPGEELFPLEKSKAVLIAPDRRFPNFIERPAEDENLLPWTETETRLLGLTPDSSGAPSAEAPSASPDPKALLPEGKATLRNPRKSPVPQASEEKMQKLRDFMNRGQG